MENQNSNGISINIEKNYGTNNTAQGDIHSNNVVNITKDTNSDDIIKLINEIVKLLKEEKFDDEIKEEIIDDLETIQEQTEQVEPKKIKLKKACDSIKSFILKIPQGLTQVTVITEGLNKLIKEIDKFIS